jgi:hypothetical protein
VIARERVINKLRELGFSFRKDHWRVSMFRKGPLRVEVPKKDLLEDAWVRSQFRQCGLSFAETEEFLRLARS